MLFSIKIFVTLAIFTLLCLSLASAQAVLAPTPTPRAAANDREDLIDKVMGMVSPSESGALTEKKRFHLYLVSVVGPVPVLAEIAGAGIGQWENSPKEWGQGWGAFRERAESNLAYNGLRQTITYGTSVMFHEDNRYFSSHRHGVWARTSYALRSTVTARHPDGNEAFSISSVAGVVGASALSSIWGPRSWEGAKGIGTNAGVSLAVTAAFNMVREFLPDLLRHPQK
jgi:hypothetical protein